MLIIKTCILASVFVLLVIAPVQAFATIEIDPEVSLDVIRNDNIDISEGSFYALDSSSSLPLVDHELLTAWKEAIYSQDEIKHKKLSQISVDPVFAFRFYRPSHQLADESPSVNIQDSDLSNILVLSGDSRWDTAPSPSKLVKASMGVNFWDITSNATKNLESWDAVFYYPGKFKKMISCNDEKEPPVQTTVPPDDPSNDPSDEEDTIFDILAFFKKWGVPKPLTVVLLGVAAYLLLAFLARE
jgi:hypothetical protein